MNIDNNNKSSSTVGRGLFLNWEILKAHREAQWSRALATEELKSHGTVLERHIALQKEDILEVGENTFGGLVIKRKKETGPTESN